MPWVRCKAAAGPKLQRRRATCASRVSIRRRLLLDEVLRVGELVDQTGVMDVDVLFAGIRVSDFEAAQTWYERFFARPADVVAHENEVMWQVTDRG